MSTRGRGRGGAGGGGRGQPRRDQPPPPSFGRGSDPARSATNPPPRQQPPPPSHFASPSQFPNPVVVTAARPQNPWSQQQQPRAPPPQQPRAAQPPPQPMAAQPSPKPMAAQPPQQPRAAQSPVGATSAASISQELQKKLTVAPPQQVQGRAPVSSKALQLPARPGFGTLGRKCTVRANHFLVQVADRDLYHYDVSITPEVSSKKVCRLIMQELAKCYHESNLGKRQLAYDGVKSMYTAGELPFSSKDFIVKLDKDENAKRDKEFKVAIKFAAKPDLHHLQQFLRGRQLDCPQDTIQVLDVVLRAKPSMEYTVAGRSFFHKKFDKGTLGEGLEYWKGFYQSLRPTQMGLSLNIDVSARAFYESILVTEFVERYLNLRGRPLSEQDRTKIKKALRTVKVELINRKGGRRYKINGFTSQPLSRLMFVDDGGSEISVVQYFRDRYKVNLTQTAMPAIQAGTESKPLYLPMELCKIVDGQRYTKKLNERQVTALLKATCQRPHIRESSIETIVDQNNYSNNDVVKDFGIQVNFELASVDARVLPPPQLQYQGTQENPRVGSWNMINKKLVNGGTVDFWTCVNFSRLHQREVDNFCHALVNMCRGKGMVFNPMPIITPQSVHSSQIQKALLDIEVQANSAIGKAGHVGKQLQLLIIILPDSKGSYGNIKLICETELGIISQCCQPKQASKCNQQYLENLSLKINVKVGGRNNVLVHALQKRIPHVTDRPTIIFGADVTHPSPGEDSGPSIAAVVASMDWPEVTKYRALVSSQSHRDEIIEDLYSCTPNPQGVVKHTGMIRDQLIAFKNKTGFKPHRIIFYRDGVSEGQFNQVLLYEMDAIRKACSSLEANYLPPVTFVVVQKRHHTRLFAADHNDRNATDKSGNILPGTVIDTKICHPTEFDFYLCSHAGIQGTSRPAHYHVLYDENGFTADQLQSLTNNLCYTYARCTRSVSIVPPAYYAHLAAFRARYYMEGFATSDSESAGGGGPATREKAANVRPVPTIKDSVKEVMFYC